MSRLDQQAFLRHNSRHRGVCAFRIAGSAEFTQQPAARRGAGAANPGLKVMEQRTPKPDFWTRMSEVHPRRSLALFACGTALGLGIAAYGLFTAAGTRIAGVPAEDIALINGRHILRSDFVAQTQVE